MQTSLIMQEMPQTSEDSIFAYSDGAETTDWTRNKIICSRTHWDKIVREHRHNYRTEELTRILIIFVVTDGTFRNVPECLRLVYWDHNSSETFCIAACLK